MLTTAPQGLTVLLTNHTPLRFYRRFHAIERAYWDILPASSLDPYGFHQFSVRARFGYWSFEARIQYYCCINEEHHSLDIVLSLPRKTCTPWLEAFFVVEKSAVSGKSAVGYAQNASQPIFAVHCTKSDCLVASYFLELTATQYGARCLAECREALQKSLPFLKEELLALGYRPEFRVTPTGTLDEILRFPEAYWARILTELPRAFCSSMTNLGCRSRLTGNWRSVYIRIVNLTQHNWNLRQSSAGEPPLSGSMWIEFPGETVAPGCCIEAGAKSLGTFSNAKGSLTYGIKNGSSQRRSIRFFWEHGIRVFRSAAKKHFCDQLCVTRHSESGQNACVVFHIIDPENLVLLELLTVKVLDRASVLQKLPQSASETDYLALVRGAHEAAKDEPDCITEFNQYLRETHAGHNVVPADGTPAAHTRYACTELDVYRSQGFLTRVALPQGSQLHDSSLYAESSQALLLYIVWQIGCEVFHWSWWIGDRIRLFTGLPGGTTEMGAVLAAEVQHQEHVPNPSDWSLSPFPTSSSGVWTTRKIAKPTQPPPITREELLDILVKGMRALALGLQSVVVTNMIRVYGRDWLQSKCRVPRNHVWRDLTSSEVFLDLEGVIYVVAATWDEVFEDVFSEARVHFSDLSVTQRACVCWASQDLGHFTFENVFDFLENARLLLKKFGKTSCALIVQKCSLTLTAGKPYTTTKSLEEDL